MRSDREQARRVIAYVDDVVLHRRAGAGGADPLSADDRELAQLRQLVHCLSDLDVVAPEGFQERLAARFGEAEAEPPARSQAATLRAVLVAATLFLAAVVLVRSVVDVRVLSAQSVLSRSDAALTELVRPGQFLYRRWKVTSTSTAGSTPGTTQTERIIEEWMDGANVDRVAGRWSTKDGQLQIAYATGLEDGRYRPTVYFSPGVYDEPRGLLNIEPTRQEFEQALQTFPQPVQRGLKVYLDRNYIYAPITGERNFNRAILESPEQSIPEMPRVVVSLHDSHMLNATPVYCVRIVDSAAVTFNWRSSRPSVIRLGRAEILRYIARDSFLSVRTEERWVLEDGRQRFTTRELVETRAIDGGELTSDPFVIDVPPGTPVERQSAVAHLSGVAGALARVPAFTSRSHRETATAPAIGH